MMNLTKQEEMMFEELKGGNTSRVNNNGTNSATANQIATIKRIAEQKGLPVDESKLTTFKDADAYIKELITVKEHKPASKTQVEKIKEYCDILNRNYPPFDKLEGGWNGTASQLIQKLKKEVATKPRPASDKQIDFINKMQFCPDCEVIEDTSSITIQEANEYITKYRNVYYDWIKTRLSTEQIDRIKQLHNMMDVPFDFKGILQLDMESASEYIIQLESEYKAKIWQQSALESEEMRGIKTVEDSNEKNKEYLELEEAIVLLYAGMGQEVEPHFIDTATFSDLKELVDTSRLWGTDVRAIIDRITTMGDNMKEMLLA